MAVSPPNALHYAGFTVKESHDPFPTPSVFIKFSEFESNKEIETEEDKGHTGTRSLLLGENRVKAKAAPKITDLCRPEQGLEDYFYHILGSYTKTTYGTKVKKYEITPNPNSILPNVAILHGFNYGTENAYGYKNALANEMEISMSSTEAPKIDISYVSDFPEYNITEPTIQFLDPTIAPQPFKAGQFKTFIGATTINETTDNAGCVTEASVRINNNIEESVCSGDTFGKISKEIGELAIEGSMKMKYSDKASELEKIWATGSTSGTGVTDASLFRALRFKYEGALIESVSGTDYKYTMQIDIPKADITSVKPSESGDGTKEYEIEFKASASLVESNVIKATIISQLDDMHMSI